MVREAGATLKSISATPRSVETFQLASSTWRWHGRCKDTRCAAHTPSRTVKTVLTWVKHFDADLYPSKDLSSKAKPATKVHKVTQAFIAGMGTSAIIFSAALGIAHPEQYELTRRSLKKICCDPEFADVASQWAFAFNVLTIVANRSTPIHRDVGSGARPLYDLLATFGGGPNTVIEFPGMGLRLQYDSGTMVLFSGNMHPHGVSASLYERICLALYSRKSVLHKHQLGLPQCVRLKALIAFPDLP